VSAAPVAHFAKGRWVVTRDCCLNGFCHLHAHKPGKRIRAVQIANVAEDYARYVADLWSDYKASVEEMPK